MLMSADRDETEYAIETGMKKSPFININIMLLADFQFVAYVLDTGDEGDFLRGVIAVSMSVLAG